jgi:signal transduction histidine kinase/CheY-like chemotaxis protein
MSTRRNRGGDMRPAKLQFDRRSPSHAAPDSSLPARDRDWLTLVFPADLEEEFRRDYARRSLGTNRVAMILVAGLYIVSGFFDSWILPDVNATVWMIRYGTVVLLILTFLFTFSRHYERLREIVVVTMYMVVTFSILAVIVMAGSAGGDGYFVSLLFCVMFVFTVVPPRFIYGVCACLVIVVAYELSAIWLAETPLPVLMRNSFFLLIASLFGTLTGYHLEVYLRRDFLLRRQLELANLAKSRFVAAASHDLRQPLHALGLFVAQLHGAADAAERGRLVGRIDAAMAAMNELFNDLLDISKLDAGILVPNRTEFPLAHLLERVETTCAGAAREKGLRLRVAPSTAWVRSDVILLERILLNLVTNAVRYTARGGVLVGCRRSGGLLRIEVWDSGAGIPEDQRRNIFGEFYQLAGSERGRRGGLGLGLAIVERLCRLLDHRIELTSTLGKGSCFAVVVPMVAARTKAVAPAPQAVADASRGKLVVVIDDDALVVEGMRGLLRGWGCNVVTAASQDAALSDLDEQRPDLIISDYRLANGITGIEAIEHLRATFGTAIPAFLISGDTAPERVREARAGGYHLLHKPVQPMALRAMLGQLLKEDAAGARQIS